MCTTPAFNETGPAPLAVSLNGQQWSTLGTNFTYLPPTRLRGLLPDVSPNTGGMVLELLL